MKIGRNELCYCGSGIKYKKCCMLKERSEATEANCDDADSERSEALLSAMNSIRRSSLKSKPHIKEYERVRKLHSGIVSSMVNYYEEGNFEQTLDKDYVHPIESKASEGDQAPCIIELLEGDFDLETREGILSFYDIMIYKPAPNLNCITEVFLEKHRYRKLEKIEFLESMLNSKIGLFEIIAVDPKEGYAYVKEVFTSAEYKMTDIGISGNANSDGVYIYMRIITYHGISFGTGLSFFFSKNDPFIESFIAQEKENYSDLNEFGRFLRVYNRFTKEPGGFKIIGNSYS